MSLVLDERRRAMLAEMGVRVFLPSEAPAAREPEGHAVAVAPARPPVAAAVPQRTAVPARAMVTAPVARPLPPAEAAPAALSDGVGAMGWEALQAAVAGCHACKLCHGRTQTVFGVGDPRPEWMVVGEAPGETEDLQGEPFVGQAGKLLDNMLRAVGVARGRGVYIANVLKCRPPGNRNPEPDEVARCEPFLRRQVELLQPRIILAMGRFAVQSLLQTNEPIGRLRGRVHQYNGVPVVVTYHPAYLLRNLPEKGKAWADLCLARALLQQDA